MKQYAIAAVLAGAALMPSAASACSRLPAAVGFIAQNDQDKDAALNRHEWRQARIFDYFVQFDLGSVQAFKVLDQNGDGVLTRTELSDKVRYGQSPCEHLQDELRSLAPAPKHSKQ